MTATAALSAMHEGRMNTHSYVEALLARAERLKELNAFLTVNAAGALEAARRVDSLRASGAALPPLAGLPIVVKDNINTRDLPTTGVRNARPNANAPVLHNHG
jgi:mandelamide amidase